ncbi:MAG: uracil-DNA glycosylase family protein [Burkholderiales bacterium]
MATDKLKILLREVRACTVCAAHLPNPPRPVVRASSSARLLIVGQAPGRKVHDTGIPWNDPSGDLLREWLQIDRGAFYDEANIAIVPMGFCYPGKGTSGDLPPRPECAPLWQAKMRAQMPKISLTLLIGQYAQGYYLGDKRGKTMAETVRDHRRFGPDLFPLPHPSPRNRNWLRINSWFGREVLPELRRRFKAAMLA